MTIRDQDIEELFKILKDTVDSDDEKGAVHTAFAIGEVVVKLLASIANSLETLAEIEKQAHAREAWKL